MSNTVQNREYINKVLKVELSSGGEMLNQTSSGQKIGGFTLIEFMVVVAIISILALIGLRVYADQQIKAKVAIIKGNASTVHTMLQGLLHEYATNEMDEEFLNGLVEDCRIHNPFHSVQQTNSYYVSVEKPVMGNGQEGNIYIWKDHSDLFHINGWNDDGNDVLPADLIARK